MKIRIAVLALLCTVPIVAMHNIDEFDTVNSGNEELTRLGLIPQIISTIGVLDVGLDQADVVPQADSVYGKITLATNGKAYKPLTNLVTDIDITGTNVTLDLGGRTIVGKINISGSVVIIKNGAVVAPTPLNVDDANTPAVKIASGSQSVLLKHFHVQCYDSVSTGVLYDLVLSDTVNITYSLVGTGTVFDAVPGRAAIDIQGNVVSLFDCSISSASAADSTDADAADGGHAIVIHGNANKVRLRDCIMITGNGGNSTAGAGGNGGNGMYVKDTANHIELDKCTVFETGRGGDGATTGGNGGHGIQIDSSAVDVGIHDCRVRNTGIGGTPSGLGGKAIVDAVITSGAYSMIFSNFAHNIANEIKFDLRGTATEQGIASPNPPDSTVINPFANVYVP